MRRLLFLLDDMDKFANSDFQHRDAAEFVAVQSCIDNVRGVPCTDRMPVRDGHR